MAKTAVKTKKKVKKQIASGMAHVNSTWNNTIVTISDAQGNVVSWSTEPISLDCFFKIAMFF